MWFTIVSRIKYIFIYVPQREVNLYAGGSIVIIIIIIIHVIHPPLAIHFTVVVAQAVVEVKEGEGT